MSKPITNEVSENISDAKKSVVLHEAGMSPIDSNTSLDKEIEMDIPSMNESSINEPNKLI